MRSVVVKSLPATNTQPHRFRVKDVWHSMIVSRSRLENKYEGCGDGEWKSLTLAAASHFVQEKYPLWADDISFVRTCLKFEGQELDVFTTVSKSKPELTEPLKPTEVTHG